MYKITHVRQNNKITKTYISMSCERAPSAESMVPLRSGRSDNRLQHSCCYVCMDRPT